MRFAASEIPSIADAAFDGRVHSVFARTVNVRTNDGALLSLHATGATTGLPDAIIVETPTPFDFSAHIAHHATVSCRAGILRIAGCDISVDLRQASRAEQWWPAARGKSPAPGFTQHWQTAWQFLRAPERAIGLVVSLQGRRPAGSLDRALAQRARHTMPMLMSEIRSGDAEAAARAAARLSGAGPGLTPAGDDFLAGLLVGLRYIADDPDKRDFVDRFGTELVTHCTDGGDIACAYLRHAATGRAVRPLERLASAIIDGSNDGSIKTAIVAAMHFGHSSGADTTFGLLCGLAAQQNELANKIVEALAR